MRSSIRQVSENGIGGSSLRCTLTCRQSSRSNLSGIYPVCTLSLWNCPLTRLASLRKGSARKSTSPRTRGEVEQAARPRLTAASKAELLPGLGHFHVGGEFATVRLSDGKSQVVNLRLCELVIWLGGCQRQEQFASHILTFSGELPDCLYSLVEQFGHMETVSPV